MSLPATTPPRKTSPVGTSNRGPAKSTRLSCPVESEAFLAVADVFQQKALARRDFARPHRFHDLRADLGIRALTIALPNSLLQCTQIGLFSRTMRRCSSLAWLHCTYDGAATVGATSRRSMNETGSTVPLKSFTGADGESESAGDLSSKNGAYRPVESWPNRLGFRLWPPRAVRATQKPPACCGHPAVTERPALYLLSLTSFLSLPPSSSSRSESMCA